MTQTATIPTNKYETDHLRIAMPVYVGISHAMAKSIIETLRQKTADPDEEGGISAHSFIRVSHSGISEAQLEMERRLRVDLHTLRGLLFDSMGRGINLDLALRIQKELGDELVFIDRKDLDAAMKNSLKHYDYFVENNAKKNQR